jgi:DNA polymerase-1
MSLSSTPSNSPSGRERDVFVILDGNALLHRAWHAIPPLTTGDGRVVNAVYGFAMVLEKMLAQLKPAYAAVAWDLPGKTFRHEKYEAYKATRKKKEQELYDQIPIIQNMLILYGIQSLSAEGYEADDIIGTLSKKVTAKNIETIIVTGDLDALQLVDDHTKVLFFQKGISETKTYDEAAVQARYGLTPKQLIDYKALRGDPSDNLPGVPGIGEKSAAELIQTFGDIKNIFQAMKSGTMPEKLAKKLHGHEKTATEMRELVAIVRDVPIDVRLATFTRQEPNIPALLALFKDLEFKTLLKKYSAEESEDQRSRIDSRSEKCATNKNAAVVREPEHIREQLKALRDSPLVSVLVGEKKQDLFVGSLAFVALSNGTTTVVIPEPDAAQIDELCGFVQHASGLITHDLKKLLHLLARFACAIELPEHAWQDVMIAGYLLGSGSRAYDLPSLARVSMNLVLPELPETCRTEGDAQRAGQIAAALIPLAKKLNEKMNLFGLTKLYQEVEMRLVPMLFRMEVTGVKLDATLLKKLSKEFEKILESLTKKIHQGTGVEFNVNSPSQLAHVLFTQLRLPTKGIKRTKTGFSTAASELEKLVDAHPVVPLIREHREIAKLKSTYVDALPCLVKQDRRVHTTFHQTATTTGRLSSSDPNLQNIPIKTEIGNRIRTAFVAEKGWTIVAADYSQIELRLAAVIAKDQAFRNAFRDGADIHTRTAAEVWGVRESNVTSAQRRAAKAINFGILYGMGPRSLARGTGLTMNEAQNFIDRYFHIHHAIKTYIDETKIKAHEQGYVETLFGRRRYFPEINSGVPMLVSQAERMAVNMPIQGTAADIIKMAMIQVDGWIRTAAREQVRLLLQVHDELVFEVETKFVDEAACAIKQVMETTVPLDVPLVVDVEVGENWGEMEDWGVEPHEEKS